MFLITEEPRDQWDFTTYNKYLVLYNLLDTINKRESPVFTHIFSWEKINLHMCLLDFERWPYVSFMSEHSHSSELPFLLLFPARASLQQQRQNRVQVCLLHNQAQSVLFKMSVNWAWHCTRNKERVRDIFPTIPHLWGSTGTWKRHRKSELITKRAPKMTNQSLKYVRQILPSLPM